MTRRRFLSNNVRRIKVLKLPFWLMANSEDQPEREDYQEDDPPEIAQVARGHFDECISPREKKNEADRNSQQDEYLKEGADARVH